jgi:HAD superfamily hydrolase (TIGR01662 family)
MTVPRPHYLLFDLGGTLMHARDEWDPIHERGDRALVAKLSEYGIVLESRVFRERLHEYYAQRDQDFGETTYHFVLRELLTGLGYAEVAETAIRSALDTLYAITQKNWILEEDALTTIQTLKSQDYQLGILSNAGDDKDVQELIEGFGIRSYFDFVLTSAKCYYRKPHPRAFEFASAHWSIPPREALMIGDSLMADMQGAQNLGMRTIWITRRAQFTEDSFKRIRPDFSIRKLTELPPTLERMSITRI